MDIKQLEYFVRVAELGGFTKAAAAALSVKQPTLSKHIRQLEVELHQNLLIRNGRGVSLTEKGIMFLAHARGILQQAERARQAMGSQEVETGKVVLGSRPFTGITKLVATFRQRFPKASLDIIEMKGWSVYEWLLLGRLDIGILYDPPASPLIEASPLRQDQLYLISSSARIPLPKSSKVTVRQLVNYPLLLPSRPHPVRALLETAAAKVGVKLNVALEMSGGSFILEMVDQGYGHTVLPQRTALESNLAKRLQANVIIKPPLVRSLTVAVPTQRRLPDLTQETVKLIQRYFAEVYTNVPKKIGRRC